MRMEPSLVEPEERRKPRKEYYLSGKEYLTEREAAHYCGSPSLTLIASVGRMPYRLLGLWARNFIEGVTSMRSLILFFQAP